MGGVGGAVAQLNDKTVITLQDGKETGKSVSELLEIATSKVEGVAKDLPVAGRWKSSNGKVFYLALGVECDQEGEAVPPPPSP